VLHLSGIKTFLLDKCVTIKCTGTVQYTVADKKKVPILFHLAFKCLEENVC